MPTPLKKTNNHFYLLNSRELSSVRLLYFLPTKVDDLQIYIVTGDATFTFKTFFGYIAYRILAKLTMHYEKISKMFQTSEVWHVLNFSNPIFYNICSTLYPSRKFEDPTKLNNNNKKRNTTFFKINDWKSRMDYYTVCQKMHYYAVLILRLQFYRYQCSC